MADTRKPGDAGNSPTTASVRPDRLRELLWLALAAMHEASDLHRQAEDAVNTSKGRIQAVLMHLAGAGEHGEAQQ